MTVETNFSEQPGSVARARRFAEEVLDGVPAPIVREIVLMVSELATNAVVHAATAFRVSIERTDRLVRVEVKDRGGGRVHLRSPSRKDLHGRGLQLVDALSDRWGATESGEDEKAVWFERTLPTVGAAGRAEEDRASRRPRKVASGARRQPASDAATPQPLDVFVAL